MLGGDATPTTAAANGDLLSDTDGTTDVVLFAPLQMADAFAAQDLLGAHVSARKMFPCPAKPVGRQVKACRQPAIAEIRRITATAAVTMYWDKYIILGGAGAGTDRFGDSPPDLTA